MAFGTAMLLIPCGIVEGFVTPAGWGLVPNVTIGVILFLAFWGLVVWRGRPELRHAPEPLSAQRRARRAVPAGSVRSAPAT
jgi:fatty acid desaturase